MKRVSLKTAGLVAVLVAGLFGGPLAADWSDDFSSGSLANYEDFQFDVGEYAGVGQSITMEATGGKLEFAAQLPLPGLPYGYQSVNVPLAYSALMVKDSVVPAVEDVEVSCVVSIGGAGDNTEELYAGLVFRAQGIGFSAGQPSPSNPLVDGSAYVFLLSGLRDKGEIGIHKVQSNTTTSLYWKQLNDYDPTYNDRVDNGDPVYLKAKISTAQSGAARIETMASFNADFSDPFGVWDVEEWDILGAGNVGLIGFNDNNSNPAPPPGTATFDDFVVITEFINWGDANGDGLVNSADLDVVRANWGSSVTPGDASVGDLSGDGVVNSSDLDLVRGNWGNAYAASVPEPGFCVLIIGGLFAFAIRRRDN